MLYFSKTILKSLILTAAVIITVFYPPEISCSNSNEEAKQLTIEDFKKKAANIDRKIEKQKAELKTFTIKEKNTLTELNDADFALSKARKSVSAIRKEIADIEKNTKQTTKLYIDLVEKIKTNEEHISKRLVALYKLYWLGKIHVLASAESMFEIFQRENALERILAHDEDKQKKLIEDKAKLKNLLDIMNNQKKEKINLEQELIKQINILSLEKEKRSKLLADIQSKKSLGIAAIESLKNSANELDQTMKALSIEFNQFKQVEKINTKNFTSFKGLLNMPVKGKVISFFGPYKNTKFNVENFRNGIDIKADRGEPIYAVCDGLIIYSSWFKGYGNMIIIAHGENYYSVYAHIEELFKTKGDKVEKDEVIATAGDTGSMVGSGLYFELRHHGKSMNPLEWLKKG
ncbi:MAG: peptidoglycan DD-metalloendopeptidase family protein [Proteobacteria bacterium]|nr:peptidoglycan DD-metalloendopeptidase family protein [Desulfobacteraceae bacterium]MBU2521485.1 peptidoglycan DD-metalloendopeptidase family protein [Pseudomonadota bacterium]MBU3980361.1 peptidoglycan DD-metalloendopeptidase family protein [Pseudomonadota bacterium]MBU4012603.1 peptidoglycan DD-metalloendopeptidase family protein [Pseudomonadota bacterium]MBU4068279.1 peptidoglycan DD-metalloendopeptidase family protein [Pseudomonadota bacterium]